MFVCLSVGKRKQSTSEISKTVKQSRNTITEDEMSIYRKGVEKCGNDWKKILGFFVKHKDLLSKHVAEKYQIAFDNMDDKDKTKAIRNRLGNIGRKTKRSREVTSREERHVLEGGARSAEEVIKTLRKVKEAEKSDPLNKCDDSDDGHAETADLTDIDEATDDNKATDDRNEVVQAPQPAPSSPPSKKAKKKGKDPLKNLHTRAESLLSVGMATAKMHMKFLKKSAESQGFSLSESESD